MYNSDSVKDIIYKDYFRKHHQYAFAEKDILNYRNWFYTQWNLINTKIKIRKEDEVLEIGSGLGGFYSFLQERVKKYVGIELDKEAVKFATNYFKSRSFFNTSIEKWGGSKFDCIFAFEVLEHLNNPLNALKKIYSLLKVDGIFCGTSPFPYYKNIISDETHLFVLHPKNWEKLFLLSGFSQIELYPMSFFPFLWRINKKLNMIIPFYIPLSGFITTTLIIAKK